ncbi:hypothetical protein [Streptomyces sp. NPDC057287]|uniref:hypothetical protein n=1 Tax=Streptomyces sp. NPDC057287 TaxID=3346086 RepID=UPI00362CC2AE
MSKISRTSKAAIIAAAATLCTVTMMPGTAAAASYGGQCGAGYNAGSVRHIAGGSVYLARKGGVACAVTIRNSFGPPATRMSVWVKSSYDEGWVADPGDFNQFAGPVYTSTYQGCADYGGLIGGPDNQITAYEVCWDA